MNCTLNKLLASYKIKHYIQMTLIDIQESILSEVKVAFFENTKDKISVEMDYNQVSTTYTASNYPFCTSTCTYFFLYYPKNNIYIHSLTHSLTGFF